MDEGLIKQLIGELQESKQRDRDVINAMQENMKFLNKLLIGNGEIGLCEKVRKMQASIKPLWFLASTIGLLLAGGIVTLILK
ncbi:MAG: hypothetical protein PHF74_08160 [Dehalococcoidales bacterium]|nr:hypothetical protein [Dehalococcoidales bacterium]